MSNDRQGHDEIMLALGQIQGQLIQLGTLPERVKNLEVYQGRIKGAVVILGGLWAALVTVVVKYVGLSYAK